MNWKRVIKLTAIFLLVTVSATAQRKKKQKTDTLSVYREFARLGQWYMNVPLQMNVHFVYKATPALTQQDSAETNMTLHYGKNDFYMQAEGMEQIANDTLVVLVNNEAKMIRLFPNSGQLIKNLEKMVSGFMPDSSIEKLARQYSAKVQDEGKGTKRITLQSRDKIPGTELFKETVNMIYQAETYQPVTYDQSRVSLVPVDSIVYRSLAGDAAYDGKLVSTSAGAGNLFFIVKEKITQCSFIKISHDYMMPPARQQDRIVKGVNGEYQPAKGFEDYLLSKEF